MLSDPVTLFKLMILSMLKSVKFPLSYDHISEFFLGREYTNFITLGKVLKDLTDAHLIKESSVAHSTRYEITREGEETLVFFGSSISESIRKDIAEYLNENKLRIQDEVGITAEYYKSSTSDYVVQCEIREGKSTLFHLDLSVPSEEEAELVRDNWRSSSQAIYAYVMTELLKDPQ